MEKQRSPAIYYSTLLLFQKVNHLVYENLDNNFLKGEMF